MLVMSGVLAAVVVSTDPPPFGVRVDPARREVVIRVGPSHLPAGTMGSDHVAAYNAGGHELPLFRFAWPVDGWARGFRVVIRDESGRVLPGRLVHHINLLHLGRRQLVQPVFERSLALGQETEEVILPSSVGVPLQAGNPFALHMAWANDTGEDLHGVVLELRIPYLPGNTMPQPRGVLPLVFDVGFQAGIGNTFDLAPGVTVHEREFVIPTDGKLLGIGGHLHEFAVSLTLVEAATGKVLAQLAPRTDATGRVVAVSRKLFGMSGDGLRLRAGRSYRVIAVYRNSRDTTLVHGGMAVMAGLFAPDKNSRLPELNRSDPAFLADLLALDRRGWADPGGRSAVVGHQH